MCVISRDRNFQDRENVISMPHIGASTAEAEENCAMMAADQLRDFLENGNITIQLISPISISNAMLMQSVVLV
ncbi:MAG: hypothetical protein Ct9H300mP22_7370 [Gammaproteobacteria bacterium]|nr:MAG: hypothetical protein Ct9H300mP22_7370 [Gammaproteobacteria bacterium]